MMAIIGVATGLAVLAIDRKNPQNRPFTALIALVLPEVLVLVIAGMTTGIDSSDKYLVQTAPAIGLLAGVALKRLTSVTFARFFQGIHGNPRMDAMFIIAAGIILWSWPITPLTNALAKDPLSIARLTLKETDKLGNRSPGVRLVGVFYVARAAFGMSAFGRSDGAAVPLRLATSAMCTTACFRTYSRASFTGSANALLTLASVLETVPRQTFRPNKSCIKSSMYRLLIRYLPDKTATNALARGASIPPGTPAGISPQ